MEHYIVLTLLVNYLDAKTIYSLSNSCKSLKNSREVELAIFKFYRVNLSSRDVIEVRYLDCEIEIICSEYINVESSDDSGRSTHRFYHNYKSDEWFIDQNISYTADVKWHSHKTRIVNSDYSELPYRFTLKYIDKIEKTHFNLHTVKRFLLKGYHSVFTFQEIFNYISEGIFTKSSEYYLLIKCINESTRKNKQNGISQLISLTPKRYISTKILRDFRELIDWKNLLVTLVLSEEIIDELLETILRHVDLKYLVYHQNLSRETLLIYSEQILEQDSYALLLQPNIRHLFTKELNHSIENDERFVHYLNKVLLFRNALSNQEILRYIDRIKDVTVLLLRGMIDNIYTREYFNQVLSPEDYSTLIRSNLDSEVIDLLLHATYKSEYQRCSVIRLIAENNRLNERQIESTLSFTSTHSTLIKYNTISGELILKYFYLFSRKSRDLIFTHQKLSETIIREIVEKYDADWSLISRHQSLSFEFIVTNIERVDFKQLLLNNNISTKVLSKIKLKIE